jgi:hypothetical protein
MAFEFGSLWMSHADFRGYPGPRDWSPAIAEAKEELKAFQTVIPEEMRVPLEQVQQCEFQKITAMVEQGLAFVIRIGISYHAVFVSTSGKIHMDGIVKKQLGVD